MDISNFKRDPEYIKSLLVTTKDNRLVTKERLEVVIPMIYESKDLLSIGDVVSAIGIFAFVQEERYAVNSLTAFVDFTPSETYNTKINDEEMIVLVFYPGSTVIRNTRVMQESDVCYPVFDHFLSNGKIPWFMNYLDVLKLLDSTSKYAGVKLGASNAILEMISAQIARNESQTNMMYRTGMKSLDEIHKRQPLWVPLMNVQYGAGDTTSKLLGAYFNDGLNSAIAFKTKKVQPVERILRA